MSCPSRGDGVMEWYFEPFRFTESFDESILARNGEIQFPLKDSFIIDNSQGRKVNTIIIVNATISPSERKSFSTAAAYLCSDPDTRSIFEHQLVVIRSDPICSSNFTQSTARLQSDEVIQLSCAIVYGAQRENPIDAVMNWSINGQPINPKNYTFKINSSPTVTEITAVSTLVINSNADAFYECATKFSQPAYRDPTVASNAPDYYKTCTIKV
jgi:hypothetical protein